MVITNKSQTSDQSQDLDFKLSGALSIQLKRDAKKHFVKSEVCLMYFFFYKWYTIIHLSVIFADHLHFYFLFHIQYAEKNNSLRGNGLSHVRTC